MLLTQYGEEIGICIGAEGIIAGAGNMENLVHAALQHLLLLPLGKRAHDDCDQRLTGSVA